MIPENFNNPIEEKPVFNGEESRPKRKSYVKPSVKTVVITSKNDVLGTTCFTSTNTSNQTTRGCTSVPAVCFS